MYNKFRGDIMKLKDMSEDDVKKLKSSLYHLIDREFQMCNFKDCDSKEEFYKIVYNIHNYICSLVAGFFHCYNLYVDIKFDYIYEGVPLAGEIEKDLIKKYYEDWLN